VQATETTLQELLGGQKQYQVPLYQRTYSWGTGSVNQPRQLCQPTTVRRQEAA